MFGEPSDIESECNARLFIADNYGDGSASMRCQLAADHEGLHKEEFQRSGHTVTVTWAVDERKRCDHGCGQWEHAHEDDATRCTKHQHDHEFSDCAWCHPDEKGEACVHCGTITYYVDGHLRKCAKKPFTCARCGESGLGNHDWPSGCPLDQADRGRFYLDIDGEEVAP